MGTSHKIIRTIPTEILREELDRRHREEREKLAIDRLNPVGIWQVTTEGDEEGRSVVDLGVWTGHIVDIAFTLAKKSFYSLKFTPAHPTKHEIDPDNDSNTVGISFPIETGTWDLKPDARAAVIQQMLEKEPTKVKFEVKKNNYCATVLLVRKAK